MLFYQSVHSISSILLENCILILYYLTAIAKLDSGAGSYFILSHFIYIGADRLEDKKYKCKQTGTQKTQEQTERQEIN